MTTTLPLPKSDDDRISEAWEEAAWLPCLVTVETSVHCFTVGDLLSLAVGCVVATKSTSSAELMVCVNGQLLATAELDVVDDRYAARLTDFVGKGSHARGA